MDKLRGAILKVYRAGEHLDTFRSEVMKLRDQWPGFVIVEQDPGPNTSVGSGQVVSTFPLADHVSVYLGDFIQDLRSALDYIAWQARPKDDTYFPICLTETGAKGAFEDWTDESGRVQAGRGARMLRNMEPEVADVIRALQPYKPGREGRVCPLWVLHELARRERHRLLLLTSGKVWTTRVAPEGTYHDGRAQTDPDSNQAITITLHESAATHGANVFSTCDLIHKDMTQVVIPAFRTVFPA